MRKPATIFLLSIILVPLFWNGMSFIHYLVEHTHTFCANEQDHQHPSAEDCQMICHIIPHYEKAQTTTTIEEFYQLKQYINTPYALITPFTLPHHNSIHLDDKLLYGRMIAQNIFRPPIA